MSFKRSVLLTAGVVLAASMIAHATSPESDATRKKDASAKSDAAQPKSDDDRDTSSALDTIMIPMKRPATISVETTNSSASAATLAPEHESSTKTTLVPAPAANASSASIKVTGSPALPKLSGSPALPPSSSKNEPGDDNDDSNPGHTILLPAGLATTDTLFSYCARVDAQSSATYQAGVSMIIHGHSKDEVAAVRTSSDYQKTQAQLNAQLATVPSSAGIAACHSLNGPAVAHIASPPNRTRVTPILHSFSDHDLGQR